MKRSKSSPGKGPSGRKSKSDSTSKPKRSFSKSSGAPKGRGGSKPFGRPRPDKAGSDKSSFRERSEGSGGRFKREEGGFDKGEFKRTPGKSTGRSFSKPRSNGDRPERFKREAGSSDKGDFKRSPGRPPGRSFSTPARDGARPERFKREVGSSERGDFKRSPGRPPGRSFSSPTRDGDRPERFKRDGEKRERGSFNRSSDKPAGGTYLRRKDDRTDRRNTEERSEENKRSEKPSEEKSFPQNRSERPAFREKRSEDYTDKRKRKRIGDSDKPFDKREDRGAEGKFKSPRSTQRSDSPRSYGEKRHEERPVKEKKRGSFEKRPTGDRPERPWNRKEKHEFYGDRKKAAPEFLKASEDGSVRLNKFIANAGICSRREADEMIEAGVISVNGEVITEMGYKVMPGDAVKYNNELLRGERMVYILLNKPKDFITTTDDPEDRKTVMNLIAKACKERVYPVGRLDRNTTGVLLFTNDGDLAKKLTHPSFQVHKIYQVELDRSLKSSDMDIVTEGVKLDDGFVKPDDVVYASADKNIIGIELHSGKNRVVRRIFEHIGYEVKKLDRVVFAGLTKKDVPRGRWRFLTEMEVANLKMITGKKKTGVKG